MYMYEYREYANEYVTQPAGFVFITLRYDLRQKKTICSCITVRKFSINFIHLALLMYSPWGQKRCERC